MYGRAEDAEITYFKSMTVHDYLDMTLANDAVRELILKHLTRMCCWWNKDVLLTSLKLCSTVRFTLQRIVFLTAATKTIVPTEDLTFSEPRSF